MKNIVFLLLILCPNMDIIRTTIYDFSALKNFFEKNRKSTVFFSILPTNEEKTKNRHLVAYFEKPEKKRQNFAGFPSIFRIFWLFVLHFRAKMKKIKKKKKRRVFLFSP